MIMETHALKVDLKRAKKLTNGLENAILRNLLFQWCFMTKSRNACFIGKEMTIMFKVCATDGYVVCECGSLKEAAQCKAELIAIDKADGVYEKGFYKIVRV